MAAQSQQWPALGTPQSRITRSGARLRYCPCDCHPPVDGDPVWSGVTSRFWEVHSARCPTAALPVAGDRLECGCVSTGPSPTHSWCPRSQRWPPQSPRNTLRPTLMPLSPSSRPETGLPASPPRLHSLRKGGLLLGTISSPIRLATDLTVYYPHPQSEAAVLYVNDRLEQNSCGAVQCVCIGSK